MPRAGPTNMDHDDKSSGSPAAKPERPKSKHEGSSKDPEPASKAAQARPAGAVDTHSEPDEDDDEPDSVRPSQAPSDARGLKPNNVRRIRIERMMSKAELARRANVSVLTIDRVEKGFGCRMDTKRKILEALGLSLADRVRVFGEEE